MGLPTMFYDLLLTDDDGMRAATMLGVERPDRMVLASHDNTGGCSVVHIGRRRVVDFANGLQVPAVLTDGVIHRVVEVALRLMPSA